MTIERLKHIAMGTAGTVLALSLGVTAVAAATRTIQVTDGIRIQVDGQDFQPKDGNGDPVELFSYNGTVYAPVRAICEEAGMAVSYDMGTRMVSVTKPAKTDTAPDTNRDGEELVGESKAKQAAFTHAGVQASDAVLTEFKQVKLLNILYYDIEFTAGDNEYVYRINAQTGEIVRSRQKAKSVLKSLLSDGAEEEAADEITEEEAREIAKDLAPDAVVTKCERTRKDGGVFYELELRKGLTKYECRLDASDGAILRWEVMD